MRLAAREAEEKGKREARAALKEEKHAKTTAVMAASTEANFRAEVAAVVVGGQCVPERTTAEGEGEMAAVMAEVAALRAALKVAEARAVSAEAVAREVKVDRARMAEEGEAAESPRRS